MELLDSYHPPLYKEGQAIEKPNTKWIWRVFWILLALTIVEVGTAYANYLYHFTDKNNLKIPFIILTIAKAYFIVFSFMHLGHERKNFKMNFIVVLIFILYFILLMMIEGYYQKTIHVHTPEFMHGINHLLGGGHH